MTTTHLPEQIEAHRDRMWRRDEELRVQSAIDAERFIEDVGFANTLTDARRAGPSFRHRGVRAAGCSFAPQACPSPQGTNSIAVDAIHG